jgi:GntR family transcriptional regulator of arabinose operon
MTVLDTKLKSSVASEEIMKWVKTGRFSPGERLPSERAMAKELRMNHLTVRRGLSELVTKGIIQKRRNVGNFVAGPTSAVETAIVLPRYVLQGSSPHPYFSHVVAGIQAALGHASPATLILSYRPGHLWEDVGNALISRRIGGVILGPGADVVIEDVRRIRDAGIEIVLVKPNLTLSPLQLCSVLVDVMGAMAALLEGVLERGHRHITFVQYQQNPMRGHERMLVENIFRRWGLPEGPRYVEVFNTAESIDFSSLAQIFEPNDGQPLPTAVVLFDEFMASAMFRLCFERNIRIPADISVAAVQDSAPATHPVPLTAGDSATAGREQGRIAAEMLSRLVAGERIVERQIHVGCNVRWHPSLQTIHSTEPSSAGRV